MKRFSIIILLAILYPLVSVRTENVTMTFQFGPPDVDVLNRNFPVQVSGAPQPFFQENWPVMPCRRIVQPLVFGTRVVDIHVNSGDMQTMDLAAPLPFAEGVQVSYPARILKFRINRLTGINCFQANR